MKPRRTSWTSSAAERPDNVAIKLDDVELSYASSTARRPASRPCCARRVWGSGPGRGDVAERPAFPVVFYGAQRAGAVVVPMNVLLKGREVGFYLEDSGARCSWRGAASPRPPRRAPPRPEPSACWSIPGRPRDAGRGRAGGGRGRARRRRHRGDPLHLGNDRDAQGRRARRTRPHEQHRGLARAVLRRPADVIFGGLPLFHVFGLTCGLNTAIASGATLTLLPRFDPTKALEILARDRVTSSRASRRCTARCSATAPRRVRRQRAAGLRLGRRSAAGRGAPRLRRRLRLQDPRRLRVVGDLAGGVLQPSRPERKPGSIGIPIRGVEMKVVDEDGNTCRKARSARSSSAATT